MPACSDPAVLRRSLRTRLVAGVLGLVLITSALVGAFSTLALRHTLMERLDEKLVAASDRAAARRHEAADKSTGDGSRKADQSDGPVGADNPDHPVPAGLDAPGQATGTLTIGGSTYHFTSTGVWIGYQAPAGYLQPVSQTTSLGWATNDLTWGMNGVKVRIVQQRLGLWYSTKLASVDASFQNAVRNFQRRVGLPQTGVVDQSTWNALDTGYSWWVDQYQATPVSLSATRSERIEAMIGYARDQLGSSYTWGGAGPYNLGFDCSGLSLQSLYRAGLAPQPIDVYKHAWPAYRTSQELYDHPGLMHVPLSQRQRGDLIFYTSEGVVTHVAIYLGDDQVIHTDWMGRPARVQHITVGYGWENMTGYVVRPFP